MIALSWVILILFSVLFLINYIVAKFSTFPCKHKFTHIWFILQAVLILITIIVAFSWFCLKSDFLFDYGNIWGAVERGTMKAISATVGIIGVGSLLLGWAYGERDKLTLGKPQIDMIHYLYGFGYGLSIIIHFIATALCVMFIESDAKEPALWSFITVIVGCVLQATICVRVVFNRGNREQYALTLWTKEKTCDDYNIIIKMAYYLSDFEVSHHKKYQTTIAQKIIEWTLKDMDATVSCCITKEKIQHLSALFREIFDRISKEENPLWEENFIKILCDNLADKSKQNQQAKNLIVSSYIHYLHSKGQNEMDNRICELLYYSDCQNTSYEEFCNLLKSLYYGLKWYQFLSCNTALPPYSLCTDIRDYYIENVFQQMILAIFSEEDNESEYLATIAWTQIQDMR